MADGRDLRQVNVAARGLQAMGVAGGADVGRRPRVCLITTGQPSTNPRLVKEADALAEGGCQVEVVCAYWAPWAIDTDDLMRAARSWRWRYVGGSPRQNRMRFVWTRLRQRLALGGINVRPASRFVWRWAACRAQPELERAARGVRADLYIAHNLGALPAAVRAAEANGALAGFDAEDLHSGLTKGVVRPSPLARVAEDIERRFLARCHYVTAASPGIAAAYQQKYGIPRPTTILNVFPLSQRPDQPTESRSRGPLRLYWFSQTIGPDRGLEDVVRAMAHLRPCPVELHLRGAWQPGYQARLHALLQDNGLEDDRVVSHPPAPPDEMVRVAAPFDVGLAVEQPVSENRDLCLTNKIFTYVLAGNAVVGTSTQGQRPILDQIDGGALLYQPGDIEALARGLRTWCEDRDSLRRARRCAWAWGTRRYNWDVEKHQFLRVLEGTLTVRFGSDEARSGPCG